MWNDIKAWWNSWKKSGTVIWSRVQVLVGVLWTTLISTDLSALLTPKLMAYWLIFSGVVTELIRQRKASDLRE